MSEQHINDAVTETAKNNISPNGDGVTTLSTGIKARLTSVSSALIDEVSSRIELPVVPVFMNEDKGREEENPVDPKYLRALDQANHDKGMAAVNAMIMFGLELVDPVPEDDKWARKLGKLGIEFDAQDEIDREFYYKKYIALGQEDLKRVMAMTGIGQVDLDRAESTFPGDEERGVDS